MPVSGPTAPAGDALQLEPSDYRWSDYRHLSHEIPEQLERAEVVEAQVAAGVQRLAMRHLSHEIPEQLERAEVVEAARM